MYRKEGGTLVISISLTRNIYCLIGIETDILKRFYRMI
jgi:hypothetical protein